jgi:hypothetical protein
MSKIVRGTATIVVDNDGEGKIVNPQPEQPSLAASVLHALADKRAKAAAHTVAVLAQKQKLEDAYAELMTAFKELVAANVGSAKGKFWFSLDIADDDQKRPYRFEGLCFGCGPRDVNYYNQASGIRCGDLNTWTLWGRVNDDYVYGSYEQHAKAMAELGRVETYSGTRIHIPEGNEPLVTRFVIDYLARVIDR